MDVVKLHSISLNDWLDCYSVRYLEGMMKCVFGILVQCSVHSC